MAAVWPKMAVEEANLFFQISTLRGILVRHKNVEQTFLSTALISGPARHR